MRKITALGAMFLLLGACATGPSAFGPASGSSGLGFETTQIERDRFRVAYTARSPEEAQAFYDSSDSLNVDKVLNHSVPADLTLFMNQDGSFEIR